MRLTKLEVHGFKAFADHLEFVFEEGVTAIVGPNGSGKTTLLRMLAFAPGGATVSAAPAAALPPVDPAAPPVAAALPDCRIMSATLPTPLAL